MTHKLKPQQQTAPIGSIFQQIVAKSRIIPDPTPKTKTIASAPKVQPTEPKFASGSQAASGTVQQETRLRSKPPSITSPPAPVRAKAKTVTRSQSPPTTPAKAKTRTHTAPSLRRWTEITTLAVALRSRMVWRPNAVQRSPRLSYITAQASFILFGLYRDCSRP